MSDNIQVGERVRVTLNGVTVATGILSTAPWLFCHGVFLDKSVDVAAMLSQINAIDPSVRVDTSKYSSKAIFAPLFVLYKIEEPGPKTEPLSATSIAINAIKAEAIRDAAERLRSDESRAHIYPADLDDIAAEYEARR